MTTHITSTAPFRVGTALAPQAGVDLLNQMLAIQQELLGGNPQQTAVISGGTITASKAIIRVDTEGQAASDDLTNILVSNMPEGRLVLIRPYDNARPVTVKHNAGGSGDIDLSTNADLELLDTASFLLLLQEGSSWREIHRCYGNNKAAARANLGLGTVATLAVGTAGADVPTNNLLPFTKSYESSAETFNARTYKFFPHGLGGIPKLAQLVVRCVSGENTWLVDDEAIPLSSDLDGSPCGFDVGFGAVNIWFKTVNAAQPLVLGRKHDDDGQSRMTNASWRVVLRAWR